MPYSPRPPCKISTCPERTYKWGYCQEHFKQYSKQIDKNRGTPTERGYDWRWVKARKMWLAANPLCAEHLRNGETVAATVVDHIEPHKGNWGMFWNSDNWQSLCIDCHNKKTMKEVFGRGKAE